MIGFSTQRHDTTTYTLRFGEEHKKYGDDYDRVLTLVIHDDDLPEIVGNTNKDRMTTEFRRAIQKCIGSLGYPEAFWLHPGPNGELRRITAKSIMEKQI